MVKAWEVHRQKIEDLYIVQKKSLKEVVIIMKDRHGFHASLRAYKAKLDAWGCRKYRTEKAEKDSPSSLAAEMGSPTHFDLEGTISTPIDYYVYGRHDSPVHEGSPTFAAESPPKSIHTVSALPHPNTISQSSEEDKLAHLTYSPPKITPIDVPIYPILPAALPDAYSGSAVRQSSPLVPDVRKANVQVPQSLAQDYMEYTTQDNTDRFTNRSIIPRTSFFESHETEVGFPTLPPPPPVFASRIALVPQASTSDEMSFLQKLVVLQSVPRPFMFVEAETERVLTLDTTHAFGKFDHMLQQHPLAQLLQESIKGLLPFFSPAVKYDALQTSIKDTYSWDLTQLAKEYSELHPMDRNRESLFALDDGRRILRDKHTQWILHPCIYVDITYKGALTQPNRISKCFCGPEGENLVNVLRRLNIRYVDLEKIEISDEIPVIHWRTDEDVEFRDMLKDSWVP